MTDRRGQGRRALVLGGLGFLGGHVAAALRGVGYAVTVAGRRVPVGTATVQVDLARDPIQRLAAVIGAARPQLIVNCAGATTGTTTELTQANVVAPARLVVAAAATGAMLVHLGSAAEYGPTDAGRPVTEESDCRPSSPYAMTKSAGTDIVTALAADAGLRSIVLRVFNPIGAGAPVTSLAGRALAELRAAAHALPQPDVAMGPLDSARDWVDARDIGRAVVAAALAEPAEAGRVYNIGTGNAVPARTVVRLIAAEVGFRAEVREERAASERSAGVAWQQADISLAHRELGWRPCFDLADAVADLCRRPRRG